MLTPALITALTVIGAPIFLIILLIVRRVFCGKNSVNQERSLVILSNLFSFFPLAGLTWNLTFSIAKAGYNELFISNAALANTGAKPPVTYESAAALIGSESLLALAFMYTGIVMFNAIMRDVLKVSN